MLYKSRAIVLKSIRYNEADLITKLFTIEHGVLSFHLKGILKSKKSTLKSALFLPFNILTIDYNYKESKSLQYLKEVKQDSVLTSIHFQISKNAVVTFLVEILNDILSEKEIDKNLFLFLEKSIRYLDSEEKINFFMHKFLISLTSYLGCPPNLENIDYTNFNLQEGRFSLIATDHENHITTPEIVIFKQLLGTNFDNYKTISASKSIRQRLLYQLIKYYHLHVNGFKKPKSLDILETVFS